MFSQAIAQSGFRGLGGFGSFGDSTRPSYDYVRSGDVIRISLALDTSFAGYNSSAFRSALANNRALRLISLDESQVGTLLTGHTGNVIVTVQALSDFAKLDDVTRLVAGLAQQNGLNVLLNSSRGEFVSQVEQTGGTVAPTLPGPFNNPPGASKTLDQYLKELTSSPTTLAVIAGAAVLLVIAMKNR